MQFALMNWSALEEESSLDKEDWTAVGDGALFFLAAMDTRKPLEETIKWVWSRKQNGELVTGS